MRYMNGFLVHALARGTFLQSETAAYPNGGQTRVGRAMFPDGVVRAVRAGIADTVWTVPAHGRIAGKYVAGFVYVADASRWQGPPMPGASLPMADASTADADMVYAFHVVPRRCVSRYGGATLHGRPVRCEKRSEHAGEHGHSYAARYWTD